MKHDKHMVKDMAKHMSGKLGRGEKLKALVKKLKNKKRK